MLKRSCEAMLVDVINLTFSKFWSCERKAYTFLPYVRHGTKCLMYLLSFSPYSLVRYEKTESERLTGEGYRARMIQTWDSCPNLSHFSSEWSIHHIRLPFLVSEHLIKKTPCSLFVVFQMPDRNRSFFSFN